MINKISNLKNIPYLYIIQINYENEDLKTQNLDQFIQDISPEIEQKIREQYKNYKDLSIQELKDISKNSSKKKDFYETFNTIVYNNFHDIGKIIFDEYGIKQIKINSDNNTPKINVYASFPGGIDFVANVKSLERCIEKMQRKNKTSLEDISDIVRGRINCNNIHDATKILDLLKQKLTSVNKEIMEIDDMITNPRKDYMGRIHLKIKDKETGAIFELQIGSRNITNFIERNITIDYGTKNVFNNNGRSISIEEDTFKSNYHDLVYKVANKIKNNPNYNHLKKNIDEIVQKYVDIQKEIFEAEKNNIFEHQKEIIEKKLFQLDKLISNTFSQIPKEQIIKFLEE